MYNCSLKIPLNFKEINISSFFVDYLLALFSAVGVAWFIFMIQQATYMGVNTNCRL